uniref:Ig-like domain-containing protein n=1 Tax=Colobus angolensis palliatus TaxID=336983 RepID=A0A2K5J8A3_COLAP
MTQRAGAALLPSALFLLCVPGCLTVSGPSTVMGTVGESLSVQCQYEEKYKMFNKYWWSEGVVRSDRVAITDHPGDLTFTVTLENLTVDNAGKYRCGIATILQEDGLSGLLPDPFFQVQVLVSSGEPPFT